MWSKASPSSKRYGCIPKSRPAGSSARTTVLNPLSAEPAATASRRSGDPQPTSGMQRTCPGTLPPPDHASARGEINDRHLPSRLPLHHPPLTAGDRRSRGTVVDRRLGGSQRESRPTYVSRNTRGGCHTRRVDDRGPPTRMPRNGSEPLGKSPAEPPGHCGLAARGCRAAHRLVEGKDRRRHQLGGGGP